MDQIKRFQNRAVLITGGDSGIGKGVALRFASEGADVIVNYASNEAAAGETVSEIQKSGVRAIAVRANVSLVAECTQLVERAFSEFPHLDILINNAGVEKRAVFQDVTEKDFDFVLGVNLKGTFFCSQAFVRKLLASQRGGRILNMSSVHEDMAFPNFSSYCGSKGAIRMLTRTLAVELGPHQITVNGIAPGAIKTPINAKLMEQPELLNMLTQKIPLGRLGTPEDVAGLAAFLASRDGDYITGSTFVIDGGLIRDYHEQ